MLNQFSGKSGYLRSVQWGGFSIILVFFKQILLVPVFMSTVGKDNYAFWLIITSISLMIRSLNLGQLNFTSNSINLKYHVEENIDAELSLGQGANVLFLLLQFSLGVLVSIPVVLSFLSNLDLNYLDNINGSYCILFLVFARVIFQYCTLYLLRLFEPFGKIEKTIKFKVIGELLDFIVTVILIYFTKSIFYTCIGIFVSNTLYTILMYKYVSKNVPFQVPFLKNINLYKSVRIIQKSFLLTLSFVIEKIYEIGLNLVIVRVYAANILPLFATTRVLSNSSLSASNAMAIPLMPDIQKNFSLENEEGIVEKMAKFWKVSTSLIIVIITIVMPFLPFLYNLWTAGQIDFNLQLVCFLFMAIAFQNYAIMFTEFLKRTNLAKQILTYNILKVTLTIVGLAIFGYFRNTEGMGLALLGGEIIALAYFFLIVKAIFKNKESLISFLYSLAPVFLFALSLLFYAVTENYLLFLFFNTGAILFLLKKDLLNWTKS